MCLNWPSSVVKFHPILTKEFAMAKYTAFVKVILNDNSAPERIISKQFDEPQAYISWLDDATEVWNTELAVGSLDSFTVIEKVNGHILSVEHVSCDSRYNFVVRKS